MRRTALRPHCPDCPRGVAEGLEAYENPNIPGLVVNPMHIHGSAAAKVDGSWVITHKPSGMVISQTAAFSDVVRADDDADQPRRVRGLGRARAEHALNLLGHLPVDWTVPAAHPSLNDPAMRLLLVAITEESTDWQHGADHLIVEQAP